LGSPQGNESYGSPISFCQGWSLVAAPLDVDWTSHTSLRAQVYLPAGVNVDIDATEVTQVRDKNASFERGASYPTDPVPANWSRYNPGITNWARYDTAHPSPNPVSGNWYLQANKTSSATASIRQDMSVMTSVGESYTFFAWFRSGWPGITVSGSKTLWALGGTTESANYNFTVGSTGWIQFSVHLDIFQPNHNLLRAEIYLNEMNKNYDFDGTMVHKNLVNKASFENTPTTPDWSTISATANRLACCTPKAGSSFLRVGALASPGSVYQDIPIKPEVGQSYSFIIWARCNTPCPSTGTLVLFGLTNGLPTESQGTALNLTTSWTKWVVPLDVRVANQTSMRAQVYINTYGHYIDIDATGNSVAP
jgi:hypothetical protein